ncbi:hypothetical protein [Paenibacillus sp. 1P07SE]|uniref:hypothetical protein n=1 Tax=Paenibacillus sp. 1P07SE TaxID=3132209 RepID=UPI0039A5B6C5
MVEGWITWLLVAFGIVVAVAGVYAYFRLISATSVDRQASDKEQQRQMPEADEQAAPHYSDRKEG